MYNDATYGKVRRVIRSCRTIAHLFGAVRYASLYVKQLPQADREETQERLKRMIVSQRNFISVYGKAKKA